MNYHPISRSTPSTTPTENPEAPELKADGEVSPEVWSFRSYGRLPLQSLSGHDRVTNVDHTPTPV
jgi:hypothetical protein